MAIIHTTPRRSGTEALLKILDNLTDEIVLVFGKILMGQFSQNRCDALKLSLYLEPNVYEHIGLRNVFIEDVRDTVELRFGDKIDTHKYLETLRLTNSWYKAFPETHRAVFTLDQLDKAAVVVRDYLLLGRLPHSEISPAMQRQIEVLIPEKGFIEFNVIPTLTDLNGWV